MNTAQYRIILVNEYVSKGLDNKVFDKVSASQGKLKTMTDAVNDSLSKQGHTISTNNIVTRDYINHFGKAFTASSKLRESNEKSNKSNKALNKSITSSSEQFNKLNQSMFNTKKKSKDLLGSFTKARWALINVALAAGLVYGAFRIFIKPSIDLETEMAKVRKTTNLTKDEIINLRDNLVILSTQLPITSKELAKIAAVGGQLGISGVKNIESFTRTVAMMSVATEMTAEIAATNLAKISSAFDLPITNVNNLGSVINELSNTTAATSTEITSFSTRVGAAASNLGLSIEFVSALGATLISTGMRAERAGTRVRSALVKISQNAEVFAKLTDMTLPKFVNLLENDSERALLTVLSSLKNLGEGSEMVAKSVELFGSVGGFAIQTLAKNYDDLTKNLKVADAEMEAGLSLLKETSTQASTTYGQWTILLNELQKLLINNNDALRDLITGMRIVAAGGVKALMKDYEKLNKKFTLLAKNANLSDAAIQKIVDTLQDLEGIGKVDFLKGVIGELENKIKGPISNLENLNSKVDENSDLWEKNAKLIAYSTNQFRFYNELSEADLLRLDSQTKKTERYLELKKEESKVYHNLKQAYSDYANLLDVQQRALNAGDLDALNKFNEEMKTFKDILAEDLPGGLATIIEMYEEWSKLTSLSNVTKQYTVEIEKLQDQLSGVGDELSKVGDEISDTQSKINNILSRRFNVGGISETNISHTIALQELELKKAEFSTFGLGTANEFLKNSSVITTDAIDNQTEAVIRLTNAAETGQTRFDSWKINLQETIRALLISSDDLDKDVTSVIRQSQTKLLSIMQYDNGGDSDSAMETNLNALRLAQDIFFGEEEEKLKHSEDLREDRINGMNLNADSAISNLTNERTELNILISREQDWISQQEDIRNEIDKNKNKVDELTAAYNRQNQAMGRGIEPSISQDYLDFSGVITESSPESVKEHSQKINQNTIIIEGYNKNPNDLAHEIDRKLSSLG